VPTNGRFTTSRETVSPAPTPQDLADAFASGTLREKTNLVLFGAQFSF
jgi:hypothetical protein